MSLAFIWHLKIWSGPHPLGHRGLLKIVAHFGQYRKWVIRLYPLACPWNWEQGVFLALSLSVGKFPLPCTIAVCCLNVHQHYNKILFTVISLIFIFWYEIKTVQKHAKNHQFDQKMPGQQHFLKLKPLEVSFKLESSIAFSLKAIKNPLWNVRGERKWSMHQFLFKIVHMMRQFDFLWYYSCNKTSTQMV